MAFLRECNFILLFFSACTEVEEATVESIILLGEKDEPQAIVQILKSWKPVNGCISDRLLTILQVFLRRQSASCQPTTSSHPN